MASGIPSSARQIRTTAAMLSGYSSKSGRTATARSRRSRTDAYASDPSAQYGGDGGGTDSGGIGQRVSPSMRSGCLLVATIRTRGQVARTRPAGRAEVLQHLGYLGVPADEAVQRARGHGGRGGAGGRHHAPFGIKGLIG